MVVRHHPAVRAATAHIKALQSQLGEMKTTYWPELRGAYRYYSNPLFNEVEQGFTNTQHHSEMGFSFPLLKRFGLAPGEQSKIDAQIKAVEQERRRAAQEAKWRVQELYVDFWESVRAAQDYQEMVNLLDKACSLAQVSYDQQELLRPDLLTLEQQLAEARENMRLAVKAQADRRLLLAELIGVPAHALQIAPYTPGEKKIPPFSELRRIAQQARPDLAIAKFRSLGAEIDAAYAPFNYMDLDAEARYNVDYYRDTGTKTGATLGVRFSAPLAIFSLTKHRRQRSQNEALAWKAWGETMADTIEKQLLEALEKYQTLKARLKMMTHQINIAQENVRIGQALAARPSLAAAASQLESLLFRYQLQVVKREAAALGAELEKAYYYLLNILGTDALAQSKPVAISHKSPALGIPLALWVYHTDGLIREGKTEALLTLAWNKNITRMFCCFTKDLYLNISDFTPELARFIETASRQGTKVDLLLDEPTWLLPERRHRLQDRLRIIQEYNRQAPPAAQFQAIHLDLEINQLPDWKERKAEVGQYLLDTLKAVKSWEPNLPLFVDLPVWLERQGIEAWQEIILAADQVVFLAYEQKNPEKLVKTLAGELAFCQQHHQPFWIGLRIKDFADQGQVGLENFITQLKQNIVSPPAGLALFEHSAYQNLTQEQGTR